MLAVGGVGIGLLRRRVAIDHAAHHPHPLPPCQPHPKCNCPAWDPSKDISSFPDGLFFYDEVSGRRVFLATDGAGGLVELSQLATGSAGWDLIVPGRYTGAG
jgi:hypothetical protein